MKQTIDAHPPTKSRHVQDARSIQIAQILDRIDTYIYAVVGFSFLVIAIVALLYTFWNFSLSTFVTLPKVESNQQPGILIGAIIDFIAGLLLVLIVLDILRTVIHNMKTHETSLRPFLFIGIVSATRIILVISAKLAINPSLSQDKFIQATVEMGLSGLLILGLAATLRILGNVASIDLTED